jgi:hypothetical protein
VDYFEKAYRITIKRKDERYRLLGRKSNIIEETEKINVIERTTMNFFQNYPFNELKEQVIKCYLEGGWFSSWEVYYKADNRYVNTAQELLVGVSGIVFGSELKMEISKSRKRERDEVSIRGITVQTIERWNRELYQPYTPALGLLYIYGRVCKRCSNNKEDQKVVVWMWGWSRLFSAERRLCYSCW